MATWPFARREHEQRAAVSIDQPLAALPTPTEMSWGLPGLDPRVDLSKALTHPTVWACVRLLADTGAQLTLEAFEQADPTKPAIKLSKQPLLVTEPCPEFDRQSFVFATIASLAVSGDLTWSIVDTDAAGRATQLAVISPDRVAITRNDSGRLTYKVNGKERPDSGTGSIIHRPYFMLPGADRGLSPLEAFARALTWGLSLQDFANSILRNGATPQGVIEMPAEVSFEDAKRVKALWDGKHAGVRKAGSTAILFGGAKYNAIQLSPEAVQLLNSRKWSAAEVAQMFGVPPHLIGLEGPQTFAGAGLDSLGRSFLAYTLQGYLTRIESALSSQLPAGQFVKFNTAELTRLDRKTLSEVHASALESGLMTVNECRAEIGLPPVDGGDTLRVPAKLAVAEATHPDPSTFGSDDTQDAAAAPEPDQETAA